MMQKANAERVAPPPLYLALSELPRALFDFGAAAWASPWLTMAPRGDGHPVLVLPGFSTSDSSTAILRTYLSGLGYDAHAWNLGTNLGPRAIGEQGEKLIARLEEVYAETGKKVSLVGWSLGGMMARQLARRRPEMVRQIISLGSPIAGDPRSTSVWRLYQLLTGHKVDEPEVAEQMRESEEVPPVPSTAIFSRSDGIVPWQNCLEPKDTTTDNIEVYGAHCGLGFNAAAMFAVADRLAQKEGEWVPFSRDGFRSFAFPSSGHVH